MVSDNCFDITGAISAGLPGRISGEQIGGMWKSMAAKNKYQYAYIITRRDHEKFNNLIQRCVTYASLVRCLYSWDHDFQFNGSQHSLSMTQNFQLVLKKDSNNLHHMIKDILTLQPIFARADPLADATAPIVSKVGYLANLHYIKMR